MLTRRGKGKVIRLMKGEQVEGRRPVEPQSLPFKLLIDILHRRLVRGDDGHALTLGHSQSDYAQDGFGLPGSRRTFDDRKGEMQRLMHRLDLTRVQRILALGKHGVQQTPFFRALRIVDSWRINDCGEIAVQICVQQRAEAW